MDPALGTAGARDRHGHVAAAPAWDVAAGRLRAFVVFLVVVHHSVLAYYPGLPAPGPPFAGDAMLWRAFPVLDPARWSLAPLVASFNDVFFMALLFLVSGFFVPRSVEHRGVGRFLRVRALRLGLPFLFCAGLVVPLAYLTSYLQAGGDATLAGYVRAWGAIGYWPTGPAWFVLLLLVFDAVAAALYALRPGWARAVGRRLRGGAERPARLFGVVIGLSWAAYAPLALAFGPDDWTHFGLLQFQTSRLLHYFVYFALGVAVGAAGIRPALLASDGALARRWGWWTTAMLAAFVPAAAVSYVMVTSPGPTSSGMSGLHTITFAVSCAASCFALLAVFARFTRRPRAAWRSASDNAYGIYLLHYAFVAWCQFALLGVALPGAAKAALVIAAAYLASWGTSALLRRIPSVARLV